MFREWWTRRKLNSGSADERLEGVEAIAGWDAPGANALLITALGDRAERVRERAAKALAERGAAEAIPVIAGRLRREHWLTQKSFAQALVDLGWEPQTDPERAALAVGLEDWDRAGQTGGEAIPLLLDRLKFYRQFMEEEEPPERSAFVPDYPVLIRGVVRALGEIGSTAAVRPLLGLLVDPPGPLREAGVPEAVVAALGSMGLRGQEALRDLVSGTTDRRWRQAGLAALIQMGWQPQPADVGLLARALQDQAVLQGAGEAGAERIGEFAAGALDDLLVTRPDEIPLADLIAVSRLEEPEAAPRLRSLAQAELSRRERAAD